MLEKGKISQYQLFSLIVSFLFGSTTILQNINIAGRDTWISSIFAILAGLGGIMLILYLSYKFPGKNLAEYSELIFGRVIGTVVNLMYAWYFMHLGTLVLRNFGDLLSTLVMPETPGWFFTLTLGLAIAYLVKNKIETMGRVSELAIPISVGLSLMTTTLIAFSQVINMNNLLPVMEKGLMPVILGSVPIASFPYLEIIVFSMVLPYVNKPQKNFIVSVSAMLFTGFLLTVISIQTISLFGEYAATLSFPRFYSVRLITVGEFIGRIEAIVLAIWVIAGFIKVGLCLYAAIMMMAHIFRLNDITFIVLPVTIIAVSLSVLLFPDIFEMFNFAVNIYPIYAAPFQVVLPLTMCVLAKIKFRKKQSSS